MEIIEILNISKKNLEEQYRELIQKQKESYEQMLMTKGALLWVEQTLKQINDSS